MENTSVRLSQTDVRDSPFTRVVMTREEDRIPAAQITPFDRLEPLPIELLAGVAREDLAAEEEDALDESRAVHSKRASPAPEVWDANHPASNNQGIWPDLGAVRILRNDKGSGLCKGYPAVGQSHMGIRSC